MKNKYADFVKISDVREMVQEVTYPLLEAMQARESEALKAARQIDQIFTEMKKVK